ncbi:MAG: GNAT family N-acetyltransferase [Dermatophilaceae bacterium]
MASESNTFYRFRDLLEARGLAPRTGSRLLLGPRRGYRTEILTNPGASEPRVDAAMEALVARLGVEAAASGLDGVMALYADSATADRLRRAAPEAPVLHLADDAWIDLPGTGFDDYLAALGRHRRQRVAREIRTFETQGADVSLHRLSEVAHDVAPLLAANQARHGHPADVATIARSLARQGELFGDRAEVLVLVHGDRTVGFVAFYTHGETIFLRATGTDPETLPGVLAYLNLAYYLPVHLAYERELRRLHLGIEASETKALRGARLHPAWLVDLADDPVITAQTADRRNVRELADREASPILSRALAHDEWAPFTPA